MRVDRNTSARRLSGWIAEEASDGGLVGLARGVLHDATGSPDVPLFNHLLLRHERLVPQRTAMWLGGSASYSVKVTWFSR